VGSRWGRWLLVAVLVSACAPAASLDRPGLPALGAHNDTSTPFNLVSVPALIEHRYDGRGFRTTGELAPTGSFTRMGVRYRSGPRPVPGVVVLPRSSGPHPVVVIAHGWAPPARYRTGSMLEREQAYLAEHGFAALQVDYRNHAGSTQETAEPVARPLGYPQDVIDAVRALRRAQPSWADADRIGLLGRSMGGGVALDVLVARPELVDAAVLYSPVSASAGDNFDRWVRGSGPLEDKVVAGYGRPATHPRFWRQASARSYLGRVAVPVRIHHGTADLTCPVRWSRATARALTAAGKDVRLYEYDGQGHRFDEAWPAFMRRTVAFFAATL
jgi:dipeptidyl aminopeptidase/acylaminoacyl peptidase